jgi:hypothetical protein
VGLDGKMGRGPGDKAADDIGRVLETELAAREHRALMA